MGQAGAVGTLDRELKRVNAAGLHLWNQVTLSWGQEMQADGGFDKVSKHSEIEVESPVGQLLSAARERIAQFNSRVHVEL